MRELDGQNDCLLERVFGGLETCDVVPLDIWLLFEDGVCGGE